MGLPPHTHTAPLPLAALRACGARLLPHNAGIVLNGWEVLVSGRGGPIIGASDLDR